MDTVALQDQGRESTIYRKEAEADKQSQALRTAQQKNIMEDRSLTVEACWVEEPIEGRLAKVQELYPDPQRAQPKATRDMDYNQPACT